MQFVGICYDGVKSSLQSSVCGVLQWSVLGPKLLLIYINELCNVSDIVEFICLQMIPI